MKRTLCLATALAFTATAAFAQFQNAPEMFTPLGTKIFFRSVSGSTTETIGLVDLITRALDRSRILKINPVVDDRTMELEAPLTFVKDKDGKRITVTFELSTPEAGSGRVYTVVCASTQLDRCADAIAQRAERVAREWNRNGMF